MSLKILKHYDLRCKYIRDLKDLSILPRPRFYRMFFASFSFIFIPDTSLLTSVLFHIFGNDPSNTFNDSRGFKFILWSLVGATRGGPNRARILNLLAAEQLNSHQISKKLNLDHKTIRHHLKILTTNSLVIKSSEEYYGVPYILTPIMKQNVELLEEIMSKMRKSN